MYQPRDHYFQKAKREGYPARSVYKLQEIDAKYKLIRPGYRVLDLGCAPGSWLQYCAERVGEKGLVVGVDCAPLTRKVAQNVHFIQRDVSSLDPAEIAVFCRAFNLVLSDLAPSTSGVKSLDQERSLQLVYSSWELARQFWDHCSVGLAYYCLKRKGFQRLHIFFPGSMIDKFESHLACTYGLEAEDFPATCAWRRRLGYLR